MSYAIPLWDIPTVPVVDGDDFPVRRIYCVGRNYAAHALEMGSDLREPPFFFMKPADAVVPGDKTTIAYPPKTENFHYEGELVVAIGKGGANIAVEDANDHIFGYAVGLDMTRRDLQFAAREKGRPWDMGKGFDESAPCGRIIPASKIGHPEKGAIWLKVNGETKQSGDISDLIWNIPESVSYLSGLVTLQAGDLLYSGTPEGVGPVVSGDVMTVHVEGVADLEVTVR